MPYKVDDEQYRRRRDNAASDAANRLRRETAEQTARRLDYTAEQLVKASMRPTTPTHKHKWATGKEKWEAVQRAGRIAAGVEKSGKRGPKTKTPQQLTDQLMGQILGWQELVASGDPDELAASIHSSLISQLEDLADSLEPADVALMQAALNL